MRILAICGSLQAKSGNLALLHIAAASTPPGVELILFDGLRDLPHFNPDIEASRVPESVTQWRQALTDSCAVLIASPEYGFSLPGVLKNGIDWVIGSGELEQKVVAITAAVPAPGRGRARTAGAPRHAVRSARHNRGRRADSKRPRMRTPDRRTRARLITTRRSTSLPSA